MKNWCEKVQVSADRWGRRTVKMLSILKSLWRDIDTTSTSYRKDSHFPLDGSSPGDIRVLVYFSFYIKDLIL